MKTLFILLAVMGVGVYLLLLENEKNNNGEKRMKKKSHKSHFPKEEPMPV